MCRRGEFEMGNIEIVVVNNHIYLAEELNESVSDAVMTYIVDEDTDPLECSFLDGTKNMVFNDGSVTYNMINDIKTDNPEFKLDLKTTEVNADTDVLVYNYHKLSNGFLIKALESLESNDQYMELLQTNPLFFSIVHSMLNNSQSNKEIADVVVNTLYSFITIYNNLLNKIGDSFQDEESQEKIQEAVKIMNQALL